jgi:hypothetical protein
MLDLAALAMALTDQDRAAFAAALPAGDDGYVHGSGGVL